MQVCVKNSEVAAALAAWEAYNGDPAAVTASFAACRRKNTLAAAWGLSPSPAAAPPQPKPRPGLPNAAASAAAAAVGAGGATSPAARGTTSPAPRGTTSAALDGAGERPASAAQARQKAAAATWWRAGADRPPAADGAAADGAAAGNSTAAEVPGGVNQAAPPANAFSALMSGSQQQGTAAKGGWRRASPNAYDGYAAYPYIAHGAQRGAPLQATMFKRCLPHFSFC